MAEFTLKNTMTLTWAIYIIICGTLFFYHKTLIFSENFGFILQFSRMFKIFCIKKKKIIINALNKKKMPIVLTGLCTITTIN